MKIRLSMLPNGQPEVFRSLQGEGRNVGRPTTFVRLQGCNLRCQWPCDSLYTLDQKGGVVVEISKIIETIAAWGPPLCITGGEPLLQEEALIYFLRRLDWPPEKIELETNGSMSVEDVRPYARLMMDYKLPSSGMMDEMDLSNFHYLTEDDDLIFVIASFRDYEEAKQTIVSYRPQAEVFISPAWEKIDLRNLAGRCIQDGLRMQTQLHKVIWGPTARGV